MGKAGGGAESNGKGKPERKKGILEGKRRGQKKVLFRKVKECIKSVKMGENTLTR